MIVNQRELSEIVGISTVTLTEWQKSGMPMVEREQNGLANEYDTVHVIRWMVQRELSKVQTETQRDRLTRLQADDMELTLATKRGTLIPVDQIEPTWLGMVAAARSYIRAEPDRLAQLLEVTEGAEGKRDLLQEAFDEFLHKLSNYDPVDDDDD